MVRPIVVLTLVLFVWAAAANAQGFSAAMFYIPDGGAPLYTTCPPGTTPIPDGRVVKIFQDVDNDGPDDTDPLATLCTNPPLCEDGPPGTVNYNQFTMNGVAEGYAAGYFTQWDPAFTSSGIVPANPNYYLRVYEPDATTVLWTSAVRTLLAGPQEISWTRAEWTCGAAGPQCQVRDEHE